MQHTMIHGSPSEDEAAAILAAVALLLESEQQPVGPATPRRPAWQAAGVLEAQGVAAGAANTVAWGRSERAQRATRWSKGIVGQ